MFQYYLKAISPSPWTYDCCTSRVLKSKWTKKIVENVVISVFLPQRLSDKSLPVHSAVEKALQARRQASLIWSILCHVWSNPANAVGWK